MGDGTIESEARVVVAGVTGASSSSDAASLEEVDVAETEEDSSPPTPRFMQDEGPWKKWRWVPYSVRRVLRATVRWAHGPPNPRPYKIDPLFPTVQHAPLWLLDRYLPRHRHRLWLVAAYAVVWIVTYALVMREGLVATEIDGWGEPAEVGCGSTYWVSGNQCGLDGNDCRPFNNSGFAFRCPANCESYHVLNPRAVGRQEVIYRPLVVGGPRTTTATTSSTVAPDPVYRGDSFICGAAIHAGVISNSKGGCGVVNLVGRQENFVASTRHGIQSIGFDSYFPLSFTFDEGVDCSSRDPRWALLAVSVVFTTFLSVFATSPALFFFGNFIGIFWNTGLATDPPSHSTVPALVSNVVGKFLPAMFVAWVMYDKMGVRRTLHGLAAQIEKTVLWLGGCWVGALTNYTFDFIPIQRLTPHDLQQQPGARAALAVIIVVLVAIASSQVWFFRQEGRLIRYLKLYILFGVGLLICLALPDLNLRIHHYILALLLLPGTSMQTRPALLYQGLLVGLFINGIARWGFDSLLQTPAALQGDAQLGSPLPSILAPAITLGANVSTIVFRWASPPGPRYDGISVLVNDVERFRSYFEDEGYVDHFTWVRDADAQINEYFRFAYMEGSQSDDYTKAGVWNVRGEWEQMEPGPSRVKARALQGEERIVKT
ncbi:hypothetical protein VTK73DRAFT_8846 [Phialemonium thermophilum]|uniref:LCCL domain-containing protein n=1 Tax=Phialemonium thermophilum TaxID=223376 RepID=A0ABR3XN38_9PEZI